jgi:hypothetical protein
MAMRILSPNDVDRFSRLYLTDELNQEDLQDLRRHLSVDSFLALQRDRLAKNVTPITIGRSEEQIAKELRADLQQRLETIGEIMSKAKREHGFVVGFQFAPPDGFGRVSLAALEISKKIC